MDGEDGFLSAYASAELTGIPPTAPGFYGVSAVADLFSVDRLDVDSSVLEDGTEVELAFRMDVQGNGRAFARMSVKRQEGTTLSNALELSYSAAGDGSVADFSEGSIVAQVGQRYRIEYSLEVTVDLSATSGRDYAPVPEPDAAATALGVRMLRNARWRRERRRSTR